MYDLERTIERAQVYGLLWRQLSSPAHEIILYESSASGELSGTQSVQGCIGHAIYRQADIQGRVGIDDLLRKFELEPRLTLQSVP